MVRIEKIKQVKKTVVIVGGYLPGIYPSGDNDVVSHLLTPAFLKSVVLADSELSKEYEIVIMNVPTNSDPDKIAQEICNYSPYLLAYSVYMWNYDFMVNTSKLVKLVRPQIPILLGGPQVTYNPDTVLEDNPQVDFIVCGSGESRFKEILRTELTPLAISKIPKVAFRDGNGKFSITQGEVNEDLSKIPSPYQNKVINLDDGNRHTVFIETFRGCPFECGYCIWGEPDKSLYKFPIDQILKDIEIIYNHPAVEVVYLTDACLFYTRERARKIAEKIESCSRKIPTVATLDILVLNEDMIRDLSKMTLIRNQFHFGLQATSPEALSLLKRKSGREMFVKKISLLRRLKPDSEISLDLIYGLPGDDYKGFRNSVDFALSLNPSKLYLSPLLLLPGTPFWDQKVQLKFDFDNKPPYMVKSNKDYSLEDMDKTFRFVLWVLAIMYFPAIRDTILKIPNYIASFSRIDLLDIYIEMLKKRIDPVTEFKFDFTLESNNLARRYVMNTLSSPENCVQMYEVMLELLRQLDLEELSEEILLGIDYYKSFLADEIVNAPFAKELTKNKIRHIKSQWVVA